MICTRDGLASCAAPHPASMLLMPGATPQSGTIVTPRFFAARSSSRKSSGMNEMSTQERPASITARSVWKPKRLGRAPTTKSCSAARRRTTAGSDASSVTSRSGDFAVAPRPRAAARPDARAPPPRSRAARSPARSSAAPERSTTVTRMPRDAARSAAITDPTMPAPRTSTFAMSIVSARGRCGGRAVRRLRLRTHAESRASCW